MKDSVTRRRAATCAGGKKCGMAAGFREERNAANTAQNTCRRYVAAYWRGGQVALGSGWRRASGFAMDYGSAPARLHTASCGRRCGLLFSRWRWCFGHGILCRNPAFNPHTRDGQCRPEQEIRVRHAATRSLIGGPHKSALFRFSEIPKNIFPCKKNR
jgi:hypothetical protein